MSIRFEKSGDVGDENMPWSHIVFKRIKKKLPVFWTGVAKNFWSVFLGGLANTFGSNTGLASVVSVASVYFAGLPANSSSIFNSPLAGNSRSVFFGGGAA